MDGLHVSPDMILPGVPVATQLTPKLLQPEGFFLKRILLKIFLGICRQVWGLLWVKSYFWPKNGYLRL